MFFFRSYLGSFTVRKRHSGFSILYTNVAKMSHLLHLLTKKLMVTTPPHTQPANGRVHKCTLCAGSDHLKSHVSFRKLHQGPKGNNERAEVAVLQPEQQAVMSTRTTYPHRPREKFGPYLKRFLVQFFFFKLD